MRRTLLSGIVLVSSALALDACKAVPLTAPNNSLFFIEANPKSIPAIGGESTISVTAFKAADDGGGTVPDGTQIFLTTDLGVIEERVGTVNGIARGTLQSDGRAGQATVTARSGSLTAETVVVEIGAGAGGDLVITVVANPALLGPFDFTSELVATVTDNRGNPQPNIPVVFSTTGGSLTSRGAILRTDANGQAFDRLTLLDDTSDATVTVTSGNITGTVNITRAVFDDPLIDFVSPASGTKGSTTTVTIGGQDFQPGATVSFGVGIGIDVVTFVNAETLSVQLTIDPTTTSGTRDVTVTNPDGGTDTFLAAFRVFD